MEFNVKSGQPEKQRTACLILGVFQNGFLPPTTEHLDQMNEGYIRHLLRKGDLEGKLGQTLLLHAIPDLLCDRLLLIGCGRAREMGESQFRDIIRKLVPTLSQTGAIDAVCCLTELNVKGRDLHWKVQQIVEILLDAFYSFDTFKTKPDTRKRSLRRITLTVPTRRDLPVGERAILQGQATAHGVQFTKDLGNCPPNICTPLYLAEAAEQLSQQYPRMSTGILDEKDIQALKMGAFLAVARGSQHPPRLITLEYQGRKDKQKPIVLIGKGITFDTGGNSLKSPTAMIGMKYDMCGAAAVLGTFKAVAELELPIHLVGIIPTAENMPGASAMRPEDIVTSMSGLTVEILNTDAEGRLILCDAITYSERFNPDVIIDVATLTSACAMALGRFASGLFSNHNPLAQDLLQAGITSGDRCWQFPIWEEYQEALSSAFADVANISSAPEAGAITAACFLARFAEKFKWAHLDIAGTASSRTTNKDRGATGRPVPLLVQYLVDRCAQA